MGRITGIVSRGGKRLWRAGWRRARAGEPAVHALRRDLRDDLQALRRDVLARGCGSGPRLADASDEAQFAELKVLGELTRKAWAHDVQVMVEGPGHVPLDQIPMNMQKEREFCDEAPFYVLGPLVTDIAPGYDHITSVIGAAVAAQHGASMLCYVTPPSTSASSTRRTSGRGSSPTRSPPTPRTSPAAGLAHAIATTHLPRARYGFDWRQPELSLDPEAARTKHDATLPQEAFKSAEFCSMCGPVFCRCDPLALGDEAARAQPPPCGDPAAAQPARAGALPVAR